MTSRCPLLAVLLLCATAPLASAVPADMEVIVSRIDGEVSLVNPGVDPYTIIYYSLHSDSGSLVPGGWTPITNNYDAPPPGNGSVDLDDHWRLLTNPGTTSDLSEGEFFGDGGSIMPQGVVSLGSIWDVLGAMDLEAEIADTSAMLASVTFDYRSFDADFDDDLRVDRDDLDIWRSNVGQTSAAHADGDANRDGVVDGLDFLVWQLELGSVGPGLGSGSSSGILAGLKVPEPSTLLLATMAGLFGCVRRRRLRYSSCGMSGSMTP